MRRPKSPLRVFGARARLMRIFADDTCDLEKCAPDLGIFPTSDEAVDCARRWATAYYVEFVKEVEQVLAGESERSGFPLERINWNILSLCDANRDDGFSENGRLRGYLSITPNNGNLLSHAAMKMVKSI